VKYSNAQRACIAISRSEDSSIRNRLVSYLEKEDYQKVLDEHNIRELDTFISNCTDQGIFVLTIKCPQYPVRLKNLVHPPIALYYRGNLELFKKPAVAIVGTRDCTRYGTEVATRFARELSEKGIAVVSGLAGGIDTAAHKGAGSDSTIAVLGNGLNVFFPSANKNLQNEISQKGLVISEYLPVTKGAKFTFPWRNRIVAALSQAVLIVEADLRSGTMITRDWAVELGLDVFVIPGPITSHASRGTNALIKEAACTCATSVDDILESFGIYEKSSVKENTLTQISFEEKMILDILSSDEVHFDDILQGSNMSTRDATTLLTKMEMGGLITKIPGNYFKRGSA